MSPATRILCCYLLCPRYPHNHVTRVPAFDAATPANAFHVTPQRLECIPKTHTIYRSPTSLTLKSPNSRPVARASSARFGYAPPFPGMRRSPIQKSENSLDKFCGEISTSVKITQWLGYYKFRPQAQFQSNKPTISEYVEREVDLSE